ncbi:MAG: peroxiredoxin [Pseudomonadota bacterium]
MAALEVGSIAPDFTLEDQNGAPVRLYSELERGPVVLYFYPKDETPGCTAEACSFRDQHTDFVDAGAAVLGVSDDSVASHREFAAHHRLPFRLLSDPDGAVRKLYGVKKTLGLINGRVTFVIAPDRTIRHVFRSQLKFRQHVSEALNTLRALRSHGARPGPSAPHP